MEKNSPQHSQPKFVQSLVEAGQRAFDPSADPADREAGLREYHDLTTRTQTWALLPALNTLVKPGILPPWLSQAFMKTLTTIPLRPDGVRGAMEFVFSVHPSSSSQAPDGSAPQKQGANITPEALSMASKLLSAVPSSMTAQSWFEGISGQLFDLMDGKDGEDLAKTAARIVGFGILGRKPTGAPGAPGWNVFVQPLLEDVNPTLRANKGAENDEDEVIDLSKDRVIVTSHSLETSLRRLEVLVLSNPSTGLCKRILSPIVVQLYILSMYSGLSTKKGSVRASARAMLGTYMRISGQDEITDVLVRNGVCKGSLPGAEVPWEYRVSGEEVAVVAKRSTTIEGDISWSEVEERASGLADMAVACCTPEAVSSIFLKLLRRWIETSSRPSNISVLQENSETEDATSALGDLFEVALLQKLLEKAPEKLVSQFSQLLDLICQVLKADGQSHMNDELVGVVLSLLNMVITTPTFQKSDIKKGDLEIIESSLERLSREDRDQTSQTASNLALLLKYRGEMGEDEDGSSTSAPSARQVEDRRTYNLAMNYMTGADNPAPVISEGLNLLSGLIVAGSPILDVTAVGVLLSKMLANGEDYINLRVVKTFTQLAAKHPRWTVKEILDHYLDARERESTDTRLRFGEALLQVIERLGETFTGEVAQQVGETLLSIAGRRGYRPKTRAKQARDERLQELKKKKKGKSADQDDEDMDMESEEEVTEEERVRNEALAQMVQGWESKRGAEDVRMRTSALSIFGAALETNMGGMGATLASGGVDLCVNVLTLEPEMEKGILRRAAVLAIISFVRGLQRARETGRSLGFGLTDSSREDIARTLEYIAQTDNDGLVKQHARDVTESLQNWQLSSMMATTHREAGRVPGSLETLAGLSINPGGQAGGGGPRIEEIE